MSGVSAPPPAGPGPGDQLRLLGPHATVVLVAALLAIIGGYMLANREAVEGPAARLRSAFAGTPPQGPK